MLSFYQTNVEPIDQVVTINVCWRTGRPQQTRGPMQDLEREPFEQWFDYVIMLSQPCYNLFDEHILAK